MMMETARAVFFISGYAVGEIGLAVVPSVLPKSAGTWKPFGIGAHSMRSFAEYRLKELVRLEYLKDFLQQTRNDFMLRRYLNKPAAGEREFLEQCGRLAGRNIIAVIAFEQPLVLDWLLSLGKRRLVEFEILVFDNSLRPALRQEIEAVCRKHGTPYLALPANTTRHVNRSHGLAMSWVFHRIVRAIEPRYFGFLDHDMLPAGDIGIIDKLERQPVYGLANRGIDDYWNLWAGYCFFDYRQTLGMPLNFLYDFSRELDTGGRNWDVLYKTIDPARLLFAPTDNREIENRISGKKRTVQFVDDQWIHIGGVSYNNNFDEKHAFFSELFSQMMREAGIPA